jgi:hypothetical protein
MNYENFAAVLAWIEEDPSKHDQCNWCGTTCCFAGFGAALAVGDAQHSYEVLSTLGHFEYGVYKKACEFFGLDDYFKDHFAQWLFSSKRTLDDFRRVRLVLARGRLAAAAA